MKKKFILIYLTIIFLLWNSNNNIILDAKYTYIIILFPICRNLQSLCFHAAQIPCGDPLCWTESCWRVDIEALALLQEQRGRYANTNLSLHIYSNDDQVQHIGPSIIRSYCNYLTFFCVQARWCCLRPCRSMRCFSWYSHLRARFTGMHNNYQSPKQPRFEEAVFFCSFLW